MKPIIVVLLATLITTLSTKVFSQDKPRNRFGVGISLDPTRVGQDYIINTAYPRDAFFLTNQSPVLFYLPMQIFERLRIEPAFGLFSANYDRVSSYSTANFSQQFTNSFEVSAVEVGLRALYVSPFSSSFNLYFGPKLGFIFLTLTTSESQIYSTPSRNFTSTYKMKETDFTTGAVFGGEYFPISEFSVGGECGFIYISFGNPTLTSSDVPPPQPPIQTSSYERKQHLWRTEALFFVRWYFL